MQLQKEVKTHVKSNPHKSFVNKNLTFKNWLKLIFLHTLPLYLRLPEMKTSFYIALTNHYP
jgi:hypothetical protein